MPAGLPKLRPYQLAIARAIFESIATGAGRTFVVEIARQGGKNEVSAHIETAVMSSLPTLGPGRSPTIIKAAPTYTPQARISLRRLTDTLDKAGLSWRKDDDNIVRVGPARTIFLSGEETANVVGQTADPLLEIDEAQDFPIDTYDKKFAPMAAANNATRVFYGTAWSELDLLHRERRAAERAQERDGVRRAYILPWPTVARHSPAYARYVANERERLGPTNPLFTTQYDLIPLAAKGRLFDANTLALLAGAHKRAEARPTAATIAAGLDIAGGGDDNPDAHDRTVLTLAAVTPAGPADPLPANDIAVLHHVSWQGTQHERLIPELLAVLRAWSPQQLHIDATGLGETTARLLATNLARTTVTPVKVTRPAKSELGFALIAAAQTGHLRLYANDASPDHANVWHELAHARADYLPNHHMNFYVDPSDGHDDYLFALALTVAAANDVRRLIATGRSYR